MSRFSNLTENRYTLSDIFIKNHEAWLLVPLFCYLLTPLIHLCVIPFTYVNEITEQQDILHLMGTGENPGDYYVSIIVGSFVLAAFLCLVAYISHIVYAGKTHLNKTADNIPILLFALVAVLIVVSTAVNGGMQKARIFGLSSRGEGLISFFAYFFLFYLAASFVRKDKLKYAVISVFLFTSTVIGALYLVDFFITEIPFMGEQRSAIFYHPNFYAYYLTMAIMLSASLTVLCRGRAVRIISFLVMALNSVCLAINDSFGGFLACLVAFAFLIVAASIKNKKFSFSALVLLVAFLAINFVMGLFWPSFFSELLKFGGDVSKIATSADDADSAGTYRWGLWVSTAGYIREKPFIGWGFEGAVSKLLADRGQEKVHNEYLDYMADFGIPAGLAYIGGLAAIFIKALKRRAKVSAATLCCLVTSLGYIGSAFFGNRMVFVTPFFFIFLGLANSTEEPYEPLNDGEITETEEPEETFAEDESEAQAEENPVITAE